jgi:hypothetical protein
VWLEKRRAPRFESCVDVKSGVRDSRVKSEVRMFRIEKRVT